MFLSPQFPAIVNITFNRFPCSARFPYAGAEPKYCVNNPLGMHSKITAHMYYSKIILFSKVMLEYPPHTHTPFF